jgi:hypothetical protein
MVMHHFQWTGTARVARCLPVQIGSLPDPAVRRR